MSAQLLRALAQMTRAVAAELRSEAADLEQNWESSDHELSQGLREKADRLEVHHAVEFDAMAEALE